jgi:MtN3 and saliva related transmembrane protein
MMTELVGWTASIILMLTISRQVYTEWRTRSTAGVSHWLFIGQCAASLGFVIYSALLSNWVFVSTNVFLLVTAIAGQVIYRRNKRREQQQGTPSSKDKTS